MSLTEGANKSPECQAYAHNANEDFELPIITRVLIRQRLSSIGSQDEEQKAERQDCKDQITHHPHPTPDRTEGQEVGR